MSGCTTWSIQATFDCGSRPRGMLRAQQEVQREVLQHPQGHPHPQRNERQKQSGFPPCVVDSARRSRQHFREAWGSGETAEITDQLSCFGLRTAFGVGDQSFGSFLGSSCSFVVLRVAGRVAGLLEVLLAWETPWSLFGFRG